jgi:Rod binding domain-containing protein
LIQIGDFSDASQARVRERQSSAKSGPASFHQSLSQKLAAGLVASSSSTAKESRPNENGIDPVKVHKLRKAAAEFEALLISNWWRTMKDSGLADDDATDPAKDTFDQLGIQTVSEAVANSGGFGIANLLVNGLLSNLRGHEQSNVANGSTSLSHMK